jgi:UDP-N-acetyl-2-amino-2-deoxyglucuronate dehydrogenase
MRKSKNFALIGAAGYVAPRHMRAIYDTDNELIAALDPSDSVGVMDRFSQDVAFFTEFERFDRHAEKLRRRGEADRLHYVSICSPNYLHDAHIRFALRIGADAICEKPLVLNPWNLDALSEFERESGRKIFNILQLRLHPSIVALKEEIERNPIKKNYDIDLAYITSRGRWYFTSWKGDSSKSGGIASNIGIHFFDMLTWIFGACIRQCVHVSEDRRMAGMLELENANVRWFLSVDRDDLPPEVASKGKSTFRSITVNGDELEFSEGFGDLHTMLYQDIVSGGGFGLEDARQSVELVYDLRNSETVDASGDEVHPLVAD